MKCCPECGQIYSDETLNFCLDDGEWLIRQEEASDAPTVLQNSVAPVKPLPARGVHSKDRTAVLPTGTLEGRQPWLQVSGKAGLLAAIAIIFAAFAYFGYRYYQAENSPPITSIAVLPFKLRSAEPDNQYLSEGLAESLIYRLSQLPDLRVSPTSSVLRYTDQDVDPVAVGRELGVSAVLSGRIVQQGDSLKISADLVDVRNNRLLWGDQYDRKMSELLATQRQIARDIVENLRLKVSPQEKGLAKNYTESNEAYQLYLKGRYYWNKRTTESMGRSIEYYQQAIEADPTFALAYSGLADTYNLMSAPEAGGGDEPPNEVLPKAKAAALKALEIDPTLAEPHVSLAHSMYFYDRDFAGAEREFKKAIELNPRYAVAHHWYAIYLTVVGRPTEALAEIKRAQELDPLSLSINVWVGWILLYNEQSDLALDQLEKTKEMDPNFTLTRHRLALLYAERGIYDRAISEAKDVIRISGGRLGTFTLAYVYAKAGMRREALEQVNSLIEASKRRYISAAAIAMVFAMLGDKDPAFRWLEKANEEHDMLVVRIKSDPRFESLRGDPRLDDLAKRMRLP